MTLYGYYRSSASYRVRIILNYKNITYENIAVHLVNSGGEQNLENYQKINKLQQVPSLVHDNNKLSQSMAIAQYLEDLYPQPALIPQNPVDKAYVLQICEIINSGIQPLHNLSVLQKMKQSLGASPEESAEWCKFWVTKGLNALEIKLQERAGKFSLGDSINLADTFIVPQLYSAQRYGLSLDALPLLQKIETNTNLIEGFIKAHPSKQADCPKD